MAKERSRHLIVDGNNVLNAWKGAMAGRSLADARDRLVDRLHDYAGYTGQRVVVVFDAWQSDRRRRTVEEKGRLQVVYTQKGETADHYIERLCDENARAALEGRLEVRVATSDLVEQTVVFGRGAGRLSARELIYELEHGQGPAAARAAQNGPSGASVMEHLPGEIRQKLERMRRGG